MIADTSARRGRPFRVAVWGMLLALAACGEKRDATSEEQRPTQAQRDATATLDQPIRDAGRADSGTAPAGSAVPAVPLLPGSESDEQAALDKVRSHRVWHAVINRGDFLARRKARGAIHGRVGPAVGPYRWFIDEKRGYGSLSVRLLVPSEVAASAALKEDDRLVVWGAWHVDENLDWYWKADRLARLPEHDWGIPVEERSAPGHVIVDIPKKPRGTLLMSDLTHMGGLILFQVVRAPDNPADGWEISGKTEWRPEGRLYLPGERETYGAQDLRSPEEHWQLERDTYYVVRIKRFLPAKRGELANMTALDAPRRIVKDAAQPAADD